MENWSELKLLHFFESLGDAGGWKWHDRRCLFSGVELNTVEWATGSVEPHVFVHDVFLYLGEFYTPWWVLYDTYYQDLKPCKHRDNTGKLTNLNWFSMIFQRCQDWTIRQVSHSAYTDCSWSIPCEMVLRKILFFMYTREILQMDTVLKHDFGLV